MTTSADKTTREPRGVPAFARWRRRALGVARVMAYVLCACLLCAALGARVVYADLREGSLQAGRELASLGDVLGSTKNLFINGAQMNVSNALTEASPKEVLDRFEEVCRAHPELLSRALGDVPGTLRAKVLGTEDTSRFGIVRAESARDGALTCFMDDRPATVRDLPDRLKAFARSHDLSAFGRLRYVYASTLGNGDSRTRVTTVWSDGAIDLRAMFPARGDAAGFDSTLVPGPPARGGSSPPPPAQVPFGVYVYDSTENRDSLRKFYDEQMTSIGWMPANTGEETAQTVVYVADTGRMLYVTLTSKDRHTLITTTETARRDTVTEVTVHGHD